MASRNFKPKASSNIIEGATPVEETEVTNTPDEVSVEATPEKESPKTEVTPVEGNDSNHEVSETAPTVTFEDTKSTAPIEKNVKIRLRAKHSCSIGGVAYHFEKGKQYNVPASVKSILMQADLLMPL